MPSVDPSLDTALRALLRSWRMRIWLGISALISLALVQLPLFGVVGFELALVAAALGSLAGLDLGAALVRRAQVTPARPLDRAAPPSRLVLALAGRAPIAPLLVIALPLAACALHGLWVPTCDWLYGLEAYFIMAVASTVLGAGGGAFLGLTVGRVRYLRGAAPWLVVALFTATGLWRFYSEPPVFSYNALIGFFPGNLYDEDIRLDGALYWSRLEQLATVIALLGAATVLLDAPSLHVRLRGRRHRPAPVALFAAVPAALLALALRWNSAGLGYAIDAEDIWAELGGTYRTAHFVIHFDKREDIAADIALHAADHELRLAQVCRTLGVAPEAVGTIHSYVFRDAEQKGRLMGARRVEMAKPWRREIYLTYEEFPHDSLRHEIAHVVAGTFGSAWFDVSARSVAGLPLFFNPGLIEGVAVAADWPGSSRSLTPHQSMRAMEELGFAPRADEVLSARFLTLSSARSYTAAGSFMRFLLERYGAAPLKRLYASGGDFQAAYGQSQATLVAAWREMLRDIDVPASDLEAARERFRQRGVFQRPCPHANAARLRKASRAERREAVAILRDVCRDAPEEPRYRLELAGRLIEGDASEGEIAEARRIYEPFVKGEHGAVLAAEALLDLAQVEAHAGDLTKAREHVAAALALPLDDERRRPFEALAESLDAPGLAGVFLRGYFFSSSADRLQWAMFAAISGRRDGLAWYFIGLRAADRGDATLSAWSLAAGFARGLPTKRFERAGARRLAVSAWRAGDRDGLEIAIRALEGSDHEVDRALAADWRERIAFVPPPALATER
jgi:hypothetical protein